MTALLKIEQDAHRDLITIEGVRYSMQFFRDFSFAPLGTVLRIDKREDGTLTVTRLYDRERQQG